MRALDRLGLMPSDPAARKELEKLDPWRLRAEGLERALSPHEFGRVLFHLNQRRGFKSNRKTDRGKDEASAKETQDMKGSARATAALIGPDKPNARTLGEYLYKTYRARNNGLSWEPLSSAEAHSVRARPRAVKGRNEYDFYPLRRMVEDEFDALWEAQRRHLPALTSETRERIRHVIFHQRQLKPVDPGPCTLDPDDKRAPLALPIVQEFRILQELANLELVDKRNPSNSRRLTLRERDHLLALLRRTERLTFKRIRKELHIEAVWAFNLESERRDHLKGDSTSVRLAHKECFGPRWWDGLADIERHTIAQKLLDEEDEDEAVRIGVEYWNLSPEAAEKVANVRLVDGYGSLGTKALEEIVPIMRTGFDGSGNPIRYSDAVQRTRYKHHSDFRDATILPALPYYGEVLRRYMAPVRSDSAPQWERDFGRIANPTVHIGLGQLRKLVNALIDRYGHPEEIVVELARDLKLSRERREEIDKRQAENQRKNDQRRAKLAEIGLPERGESLLRLRLWEELNPNDPSDRKCVYTGEQISLSRLFSDDVETEHILPFTLTLDDNPSNLTVSLRKANRFKGNLTPHQAFGSNPMVDGRPCNWPQIMLRASALPKAKQWRFRPDAIELVQSRIRRDAARQEGALPKEMLDDIERTGGFLARQLVDTAYLARVTRQYLWKICDPDKTWVIPGQMTALLRRKWGLNSLLGDHNRKNRADHRHHAIDAFVTGLTDRSLLQRIATAAEKSRDRLIDDMPDPYEGFREELKSALQRVVVSHRPDHSAKGKLHEETAYGLVEEAEREGGNVVARKPIEALSESEIDRVRDPVIRDKLKRHLGRLLAYDSGIERAKAKLAEARRKKDAHAIERAAAELDRTKRERKQRRKDGAKDFRAALAEFGRKEGIRRVRLVKSEAAIIAVRDRTGHPYKAYSAGDNHRVEVFARPDGSWGRDLITVFDANRPDFAPSWRRNGAGNRLVAIFHKNDLVRATVDGEERTMRVVSLWDRYLQLAGHEDTNLADRYRDGEFKWTFANYDKLKEMGLRRVTVDFLGHMHDPGPPK